MKLSSLIVFFLISSISFSQVQKSLQSAKEKIITASNAYLESIYDVDTSKVYQYIDKELFKKGAYYSKKNKTWTVDNMTFTDMVSTAEKYNSKGTLPPNSPKIVRILDMEEKIANVKVEAIWGIDYLLLLKDEQEKWKITDILWQSYTPEQWEKVIAKMKARG